MCACFCLVFVAVVVVVVRMNYQRTSIQSHKGSYIAALLHPLPSFKEKEDQRDKRFVFISFHFVFVFFL